MVAYYERTDQTSAAQLDATYPPAYLGDAREWDVRPTALRTSGTLAALAVLLTGCSDDSNTDPTVTPPPVASGLPSAYEVPPITDPLSPGRFATDPCTLLTPEQRVGFGLPDTEKNELAGTAECLLHPSGDTVTTVQLQLMTDRGLADLVAQCRGQNAPTACATWTPTTVEQYPAVLDNGGDQCRLMTGVTDQPGQPAQPCHSTASPANSTRARPRPPAP